MAHQHQASLVHHIHLLHLVRFLKIISLSYLWSCCCLRASPFLVVASSRTLTSTCYILLREYIYSWLCFPISNSQVYIQSSVHDYLTRVPGDNLAMLSYCLAQMCMCLFYFVWGDRVAAIRGHYRPLQLGPLCTTDWGSLVSPVTKSAPTTMLNN